MKKFAFTLAEVLITLAIVGIVAAITIPGIVANHQKRALEAQFAKAYRTVHQVVNLATAQHGEMGSWDWGEEGVKLTREDADAFVKKYILPYLNAVKFCPTDKSTTGCFSDAMYTWLDGSNARRISDDTRPQILLADGTSISIYMQSCHVNESGTCLDWQVDINGGKKPNRVGRDYFVFSFFPQTNELLPLGVNKIGTYSSENKRFEKYTPEQALETCKSGKNGSWACTAVVVQDGFKMNY